MGFGTFAGIRVPPPSRHDTGVMAEALQNAVRQAPNLGTLLDCKCPNLSKGCPWSGGLLRVSEHLRCVYRCIWCALTAMR